MPRIVKSYSLSTEAILRLEEMAEEEGRSASRIVERLILGSDWTNVVTSIDPVEEVRERFEQVSPSAKKRVASEKVEQRLRNCPGVRRQVIPKPKWKGD